MPSSAALARQEPGPAPSFGEDKTGPDVLLQASALQLLLSHVPTEQAAPYADKAAESVVATLLEQFKKLSEKSKSFFPPKT